MAPFGLLDSLAEAWMNQCQLTGQSCLTPGVEYSTRKSPWCRLISGIAFILRLSFFEEGWYFVSTGRGKKSEGCFAVRKGREGLGVI